MICQNPPKLSSAILWLEINVVILAVFLGIWSSVGGNLLWSIPSGIGAGAALLAVIVHRMNGRMSAREWFLLFLVFACMGGLLWLLVTFLAAPTGQGVVMIWDGFLSAMQFIGGQIQRFLTFLTSFLKPEHYEEVELEDLSGMNMDTSANEAMAASFGRFLAIFVIVAVILAVVAALIVFGHVRLTRKTIQGSPQKKRQSQRPSLLDAVRELLRRVSAYLHLKKALWAARNTELGVYFALVRLCKRSAYRQQTGDTPSTFLARLEAICGEPELSRSLAELRGRVESSLYSGKDKSEHFPNGKVLKQQIKKQIRHEKSSKSNV
jgi:large-conductance mechanosensitive channel